MKVLFLGEFSGVYNELIPELKKRGIEVYHIAAGDDFKGYPSDLDISANHRNNIFKFIYAGLGILGLRQFIKKWKLIKSVSVGYDVVQMNCPHPFNYGYWILLYYYRFLKKNNKAIYLSVLGADYYVLRYLKKNHINRMFDDMSLKQKIVVGYYEFVEIILANYVNKIATAIMPMCLYYKESYNWNSKTTDIVPISVSEEKIGKPLCINENDVVKIFHGWQLGREKIKGNDVFDRVIKRVQADFPGTIEYEVVHNVPYNEYVKMFSDCHLFIDQLYADDKGMNALLGMAAGKVVFSGFKEEALSLYPNYDGSQIGIPAYDDEDYLYNQLKSLVTNKQLINKISENAIRFVRMNQTSGIVADRYLEIWKGSSSKNNNN
jgi:glycosyltransferase involved in cell wall biosynthesis